MPDRKCEGIHMIPSEQPGPMRDKRKEPPNKKRGGSKKPRTSSREAGVQSAHDVMREFLKKTEG